jgi:hypothetical protein
MPRRGEVAVVEVRFVTMGLVVIGGLRALGRTTCDLRCGAVVADGANGSRPARPLIRP